MVRSRAPCRAGRDLRLDLFRGLANWAIFLDHIPDNLVNWITTRNYGFSDAADIFVFISGYTVAFVYARPMWRNGFLSACARILKRVWQIYLAHVFLFVIYLAEIAYLAARTDNPVFVEEFNVFGFLREPDLVLSLEVFCFGIFLSFAGHFVLVEISNRAWMQVVVSFAGIALMTALAYLLTWYQRLDKRMAEAAKTARRKPAVRSGDRG